jgi:hypothetical protein
MAKRTDKMLTVKEAAAKIGSPEASIRVWLNRGRFPGAHLEQTPIGPYWLIPESALENFKLGKAGRPPKAADATDSIKPKTEKKASSEKKSKTVRKAQED